MDVLDVASVADRLVEALSLGEQQRVAAAAGSAVLVATHDPTLLARADRTIHLVDGHVAQTG